MRTIDAAVLCGEPLGGYKPDDIRKWLQKRGDADDALAEVMAEVSAKVGWLHHEMNDPDNDAILIETYREEYGVWWLLETELTAEIIRRLERQNLTLGTDYATTGKGWHYIIEPFMEQNGYRDGAGWWIKK